MITSVITVNGFGCYIITTHNCCGHCCFEGMVTAAPSTQWKAVGVRRPLRARRLRDPAIDGDAVHTVVRTIMRRGSHELKLQISELAVSTSVSAAPRVLLVLRTYTFFQ